MRTIRFFLYCSLHKSQMHQYSWLSIRSILDITYTLWIAINHSIHWKTSINTLSFNNILTIDRPINTNCIWCCEYCLYMIICFFTKTSTNCHWNASDHIPSGQVYFYCKNLIHFQSVWNLWWVTPVLSKDVARTYF